MTPYIFPGLPKEITNNFRFQSENNVVTNCCKALNIPIEEVKSKIKTRCVSDCRTIISKILSSHAYRHTEIGRILNKDRSSVNAMVNKFDDLIKYDYDFKIKVDKCLKHGLTIGTFEGYPVGSNNVRYFKMIKRSTDGKSFFGVKEASRYYGLSEKTVRHYCNRQKKGFYYVD